jgi:sulfide:quinone oxidoreductase
MIHYQVIISGGGNAGVSVAALLLCKNKTLNIDINEPSENHFYQPACTLAGSGAFDLKRTSRSEASVIPKGAKRVKAAVAAFQPEKNELTTKDRNIYSYDFLIVASGIKLNWNIIKGVSETLGKNKVTSNYSFDHALHFYVYKSHKNIFRIGDAISTPNGKNGCGRKKAVLGSGKKFIIPDGSKRVAGKI